MKMGSKGSKTVGIEKNPERFAEFVQNAIQKASESASIFSIQLLQDLLSCDPDFKGDAWEFRINVPGTISDTNWSLVMPLSLEQLLDHPFNRILRKINVSSGRI